MPETLTEDIFEPRDIDLDDDGLDEFEKELEAFKRFCLDSIPLVRKERVRVELKNSDCFKEFNERFANTSKILNKRSSSHRHSSSSSGKRKGGSSGGGQYPHGQQDMQNLRILTKMVQSVDN